MFMETTIVVVAFAHCGTTMTTGVFEALGVPMVGENYLEGNWEDQDAIESIEHGDESSFRELVAKRNAESPVWGFKYTEAYYYMDKLRRNLRNPVYFAIWKDPMSVTQRKYGYGNGLFLLDMQQTCIEMKRAAGIIFQSGEQVNMLSYSQAIAAPHRFVQHLVDISGLTVASSDIEMAAKTVRPNVTDNWREPYPQVRKKDRFVHGTA